MLDGMLVRLARRLLIVWTLTLGPAAGIAAEQPVDLELVLAVDVSRSIDAYEFELQRAGYVEAFRDPRVIGAIRSGGLGAIAVTLVQWSGALLQHQAVGWFVVSDTESGFIFAELIANSGRLLFGGGTSVSGAVDYSSRLFERNDFEGLRRVIDISGDGVNNNGRLPDFARDAAVAQGITINGLAILNEEPLLDTYYRDHVIGGPGAFILTATSFETFATAIIQKLIREISALP